MTFSKEQLPDERLVKILSETQATINEHNRRQVRGSVEVDARLFESMLAEIRLRRHLMEKAALAGMEAEPVAYVDPHAFQNFSVYRAGETDNKRMGREWMWANPDAGLIPVYTAPQPLTTSERAELENYRNAQQVVPECRTPPETPRISSEELDDETLDELIEFRRGTLDYHTAQGNKVQTIMHCVTLTAMIELKERRAAMQSGAVLPPMQPMVIDSGGILRFKENPLVRKLLDVATAAGYGLNAMALEEHSPDDRMQLAQLIGYSLSGYGDLSYVSDESYNRAAAVLRQEEK